MRLAAAPRVDESGRVPSWPPLLATRGAGGASGLHAHHAMHVVVASEGELAVRMEGAERRAPGVVTAPDVRHSIDARGLSVLLVFLDPESEAGASLGAALGGPARLLDDDQRKWLLEGAEPGNLMRAGGAEWTRRAVELLGAGRVPSRRKVHPRVKKLLGLLRDMPPDADASLEALARAAGLSPGRLMHAFTESIGIPLRPYLQWLKLQRAAAAIAGGLPLAEAAHAAGFADAAHMTRTFRQMLGTTPSALRPPRS
jgi:AraC-like DNA-binding protein